MIYKVFYHLRRKMGVEGELNSSAFLHGFVQGMADQVHVWRSPVVMPPPHSGIQGDWRAVGAYMKDALRKEKAREAA